MKKLIIAAAALIAVVSGAKAEEQQWATATYADYSTTNLVVEAGVAISLDCKTLGANPVGNPVKKLELAAGTWTVDSIVLPNSIEVIGNGTLLKSTGEKSVFAGSNAGTWSFKGIAFEGCEDDSVQITQQGGAIDCEGGVLKVESCAFTNFIARQYGGSVNARLLSGDSIVSNCTFFGNFAGPENGEGGAIYASASRNGVSLSVQESEFTGNLAANGGAIDTVLRLDTTRERPITLKIGDGCVFEENEAEYEGGAILASGDVFVEGSNTVFSGNVARNDGGAICINNWNADAFYLATLTISNGVSFADNKTTNAVDWATGGAISLMLPGYTLNVYNATFTNNMVDVKSAASDVFADGGAIYLAADEDYLKGCTATVYKTSFCDNYINAKPEYGFGGAIAARAGNLTIDTCVFDCGMAAIDVKKYCYGDAIDIDSTTALIKNTTIRRGQSEGLSAYAANLAITNCVMVGNGLAYEGIDVLLQDMESVTMDYNAYGAIYNYSNDDIAEGFHVLSNRTVDIYDGDTLKLCATNFNPVAGLGLAQAVTDFVEVQYGSKEFGYSMGAYETPTPKLALLVEGTREYDGTNLEGESDFTFSIVKSQTNLTAAAYPDLVPANVANVNGALKAKFDLTQWTYDTETGAAGLYDSTNASPWKVIADVEPVGATNAWLATLLDYRYRGEITPSKAVAVILTPTDYPWTGGAVKPAQDGVREFDGSNIVVVVSNKITQTVITEQVQIEESWDGNIGPTNAALYIVKILDGDFAGTVFTNTFSITAYITEYYKSDSMETTPIRPTTGWEDYQYDVTTNGWLAGSNAVAKLDGAYAAPAGYCFDPVTSKTNAEVKVWGGDSDTTDHLTRLYVVYEKDVVGGTDPSDPQYPSDNVPDKYQKKVLYKIVNAYWDEGNGYAKDQTAMDQVVWVTMTNGAGTWAFGSGTSAKLSDFFVPSAGTAMGGYASEDEGEWVNCLGGDALADAEIGWSELSIFLWKPNHSGGRNPGRPLIKTSAGEQLESTVVITDFSFDGGRMISGKVDLNAIRGDGSLLLENGENPIDRCMIEVFGVEKLGDKWESLGKAKTDASGNWTLLSVRNAKFFRVNLAD